ncbi:MAG: aminopeptidase P family protein [Actinobacteria bacterium]|nr:aminopeptidase P family protein [Actinomycetota bacterium]
METLQSQLDEPLLVTAPVNVNYLTGFESTNPALFVEPDRARLFSDFRYAAAGKRVEDVEFTVTKRNLFASLADELSGRIGFEADAVTYAAFQTLEAGGLELVPRRGVVEALRAVKDEGELALIRRAGEITSEAFARLAQEQFSGRTEKEVAWRLDSLYHELGADGPAFPTIVAAGENGATPHAHAGDCEIPAGTTVVVDSACALGGYVSDCTRTFATGPLPDRLAEAYEVCLAAQQAGLDAVRPGVTGREADAAARDVIEAAGFGEEFGHGLGHGLGLLVHEAPRLSQESEDTLDVGNVVTVEPGIYLSGLGGIRIEDLVIVGDAGPEILTTFTKELVTVA